MRKANNPTGSGGNEPPKDNIVQMPGTVRDSNALALTRAMQALREKPGININGRKYATVKDRVEVFREHFGVAYGIVTEVNCVDPSVSVGSVVKAYCVIRGADGFPVATGTAMEYVGSNDYTENSAFEVAETSAIGRALASFGLHGGEFASANEVANKRKETVASRPVINNVDGLVLDDGSPEEMYKSVVEAVGRARSEAELTHYWQEVSKRMDRLRVEDREAVRGLFKTKYTAMQEMNHRKQQEK